MFEKYTLEAQKILTMAESLAFSENDSSVEDTHLLLAFVKTCDSEIAKLFARYNVSEERIIENTIKPKTSVEFASPLYMEYSDSLKKVLTQSLHKSEKDHDSLVSGYHLGYALLDSFDNSFYLHLSLPDKSTILTEYKKYYRRSSSLDKICDLHRLGERKLDPLVGREDVINELITILKRRNKPNPLLIGEPGIGKSFIIEHLADRMAKGEIPGLEDKTIFEFDLPSAVSGTKYRGEFEEKIKKVIQKVIDDKNAILFVDEIHNIVKAGGAEGAIDCSNIIKPYLARGDIQIIGATTYDEYEKVFSTDKALKRRFQVINMKENTSQETICILQSLLPIYEEYYHKTISPDIPQYIVGLAKKHLPNLSFPDKAIDILDNSLSLSKDRSLDLSDIEKTMKRIYYVTPNKHFNTDSIVAKLKSKIYGQDEVLKVLKKDLRLLDLNFETPRPAAVLFLAGPSGVGKSYLAKTLSTILYSDDNHFLKVDLSTYKDPSSITGIIGSTPGYVGYKDESEMVKKISKYPSCLILLDEVDKAHPAILDTFLSIFEDGYFVTSTGKKIDCTNVIFILTSNIGFHTENDLHQRLSQSSMTKKQIEKMLSERFKYEFLARLDDIIVFNSLSLSTTYTIEKEYLKNMNITLEAGEEFYSCEDRENIKKYGARAALRHAKNYYLNLENEEEKEPKYIN